MGAVLVCNISTLGNADIVELPVAGEGEYASSETWTTDFDLGVTFTEISNVYIDWSGEITGGLAINYNDPDNPFPIDVGIGSYLERPLNWRHVSLWGGESTYPNPEPFDYLSEYIYGGMPWSELYDGQGTITIEYKELIMLDGSYIEHGSITLDSATLVVEGIVVPEIGRAHV